MRRKRCRYSRSECKAARPSSTGPSMLSTKAFFPFRKKPIVCGKVSTELAKMTGITPPEFTRRGRCVDCPPITLRPTTRFAYCTGMRRSLRSTNTMKATTASMTPIRINNAGRVNPPHALVRAFSNQVDDRARQADDDAGKDQQRHTVADAAFRDLLAEPHDECRTRGERQHGHQHEADTGLVTNAVPPPMV